MKGRKTITLVTWTAFLLLITASPALEAQSNIGSTYRMLESAAFYENFEIRQELKETVFAPFLTVLNSKKKIFSQSGSPIPVKFEVRKTAEHFYLLFLNEFEYSFPVWGRGSYIIKRDILSGRFLQLKVFIQNDEGSYVRLFPEGSRTRMDVYLFGVRIYESILIPVEFERMVVSPFSMLINLTSDSIDWSTIFTDVSWSEWDMIENMVRDIRPVLPLIKEVDDGAQNRFGDYVFIETEKRQREEPGMNCSGFVKWIGDGVYSSYRGDVDLFGPYMDLETLKREPEYNDSENSWNENYRDRDPLFGLDWIRNIASELYEKKTGVKPGIKDFDVNETPFFHYTQNVGYALEELMAVLYLQAVKNPGSFFLGAINTEFGSAPVLRQYRHVAAFFPWFTEDGNFHVSVMDTGVEKFPVTLEDQFPGGYIHLVRIEGVESLNLPSVNP
ncbi:MAG: hypothetical protein JXR86_15230 [Spirochaetales bacterium]|nr:hypothetical protein [Spirochaetales bacterium]